MSVIMGTGEYAYRVEEHWPHIPDDIEIGNISAVEVGNDDRVYLFNRGPNPMIVVDTGGNFIRPEGRKPSRALMVFIGGDGYILLHSLG